MFLLNGGNEVLGNDGGNEVLGYDYLQSDKKLIKKFL